MTRRGKNFTVYSSTTDERLAVIIAEDYKRNPEEFTNPSGAGVNDTKLLLRNTSARGIEPMKKWL